MSVVVLRWYQTDNRLLWVLLALLLATGWSTTGLVIRFIEEASAPEITFYRGLCLSFAVTLFVASRYRINTARAFRAIGWPGLMGAVGLGLASVTFIAAIERTTIANISFLIAATPFFAGGLAWLIMREAMAPRTIAATGIAMIGIVVMVGEGFAVGSWLGNLLALACAFLSAFYVVGVRLGRGVDMVPTVALSGLIAAGAAATMIDSFYISLHDFMLCALQGIFISAVCNGLFTLCARHIPAGELTVLSMLESVLSPLWVFLILVEIPSTLTIIGGAIVLGAVSLQAFWPRRWRRNQAP
ncbi:MAG: EamA family transporter [Rhodospirillaceae bacterium]|nr:EamA family transporter [Rhodospirillaceae bacterium]